MRMHRKSIELMAPAGSYESLMAAVQGGADTVYFGVENLNMRAGSTTGFTLGDLERITAICRGHGIRSCLALNIVLFDDDMERMHTLIDTAVEKGVDAVIASDMAAILYAREKGMSVHLSTQVNISNTEALRYFARYADVIVLARELHLGQVYTISRAVDENNICGPSGNKVRLEMFVHGALCLSVSGKCYMSLHEMNASANRGECLQPCRRAYTVRDKETGYELDIDNEYVMSPKDLCTIHFLNKILDTGVRVLKIEGRARSAEYVRVVTGCYDEAIHAWCSSDVTPGKIETWMERLATVFNRGFWDGYYLGQRLGEWSHQYGSVATRQKTFIGKIHNYYARIGVAEIMIQTGSLHQGDELLIMGPTTGVVETKVTQIRLEQGNTESAVKGEVCSIPVGTLVRRGDKVYLWMKAERKPGQ